MDWTEDYKRKLISADDAAKCIKSGDVLAIPVDTYVKAMSQAIIHRRNELENVRILLRSADSALGWTNEDLRPSFFVVSDTTYRAPSADSAIKAIDFIPALSSLRFKGDGDPRRTHDPRRWSAPSAGYRHFGVWHRADGYSHANHPPPAPCPAPLCAATSSRYSAQSGHPRVGQVGCHSA